MAPKFDSFDSYLSAREELIEEERSLRRDHQSIRIISEAERAADQRLRVLRTQEAESLWKSHKDPNGRLAEMYPGMGFLTAKEIIHKSEIFKIMKAMPKGALLHAHFEAICDFPTFLDIAISLDNGLVHVVTPVALTPANVHDDFPEFRILDPESPPELLSTDPSASLTSPTYKPSEWIPLQVARDNFKLPQWTSNDLNGDIANKVMLQRLSGLEGAAAFDTWAAACAALDPAEAHETRNSVDEIWKRFQRCFGVTRGLSYHEPIFRKYCRAIFEHCLEESISYIEIRIVFSFLFMTRANGRGDVPHSEWMLAFQEELNNFKGDLAVKGLTHKFIGAKVIYTSLRFLDHESLDWCLNDCIELKKQFPDILCGFDLVGQEDNGRPLIDFADRLLAFQGEVARQGLYIPFLFHAGETLGDGTSTDQNLYDAILLGTKRIGHGFSIARHPKLMSMCRDGKILLEVCPISNEILRLTSSMPTHPLPAMLNNGVPVALSSDDPAMFGSLGLAYDFYQVFVASEINGLTTLGTMACDSIQWAELDPAGKDLALRQWREAWDEFVDRVANNGI